MARRTQVEARVPTIIDVPDPTLEPGDAVRIKGSRGSFRFVARRQHVKSGAEWLDVWGGMAGRESLRSVDPELVTPVRRRRKKV